MRITVKNLQKKVKINPSQIKGIANNIYPPYRFQDIKLVIYFIENNIIKRLNKQFFHKHCLTDVISFNLAKDYAEIFVAPCVVRSNAVTYDVKFKEELDRCIIHGILHIFGYEDITKKQRQIMWKKQEYLLRKCGREKD